ncbi:MAG TPA: NlpC/P60 family protein [Nocardia sp.]|uniref:NlpC/P60 family protein n=1 Tax=Nocardia TaxID=1817 RepID=UPI002453FFFA|nr:MULTISPECIES: NlpC/P60 family protein [Nocardia]HLS77488.1 NlpC/P60 family protein [Nocardia sp.]
MIDINLLVKPLLDLLSSFGTGVQPAGGPADSLLSASSALDQLHQFGKASINQLNDVWDGQAADSATSKALRVQTSAATISDRSTEMAAVVNQAAAEVETGQKDLDAIVRSFVNTATALGPAIATPQGFTVLVGSAIEHLNQGIGVVGRVRGELDTQTAAMTQLTPPPSSPAPASLPGALTSGVGSNLSTLVSMAGQAGSLATSLASAPLQQAATSTDTSSTPASTSTPSGQNNSSSNVTSDGVKITLPDGSVVEAPNEKAAKAVTTALTAQGTPYVWGGNTPGVGIDCSGLTKWAYGEAGVELPRLAQEQHIGHPQVSPGDLMPGDLAVWDGHVAMVIGNGQLIEAGDPVSISNIRTENMGMEFYGFYRPTE